MWERAAKKSIVVRLHRLGRGCTKGNNCAEAGAWEMVRGDYDDGTYLNDFWHPVAIEVAHKHHPGFRVKLNRHIALYLSSEVGFSPGVYS